MEKLWDKIKRSVMDGVSTAAEKTEEYTKLGKAKLDVLSVKHKITRNFSELGGLIYDGIKEDKAAEALESEKVKTIVSRLNELDEELAKCENELESLAKDEKQETPGEDTPEKPEE